MNDMTTVSQTLPAHLQGFAGQGSTVSTAVMGGISMGGHPRISIKGARWRLQAADGAEEVLTSLHLDVIIVDANLNVSKAYYAEAYNPANTEYKAPDCASDNGVGPNADCTKPQAATCAVCPHNVWGSKVTPSGTKIKACADSKKLAVILADNPTGTAYELKIPAASMGNLAKEAQRFTQRGYDIAAAVLRLTFDDTSDYPKVKFAATGWLSPAQAEASLKLHGTPEIDELIGKRAPAAAPAHTPKVEPEAHSFLDTPPPATLAQPEAAPARKPRKPKEEAPAVANIVNTPQVSDAALDDMLGDIFDD